MKLFTLYIGRDRHIVILTKKDGDKYDMYHYDGLGGWDIFKRKLQSNFDEHHKVFDGDASIRYKRQLFRSILDKKYIRDNR